jgi:hypothetical protein
MYRLVADASTFYPFLVSRCINQWHNVLNLDLVRCETTVIRMDSLDGFARTLKQHIFGEPYDPINALGFVGIGKDDLHVYIRCSRKKWRGKTLTEWQGISVRWHFGVGKIKALVDV